MDSLFPDLIGRFVYNIDLRLNAFLSDIAHNDVIVIHLGVAVVELQNIEIPRPVSALGCGAAFLERRDAACSAFEGANIVQCANSWRSSDRLRGLGTTWAPRQDSAKCLALPASSLR
jgi:hypothetical protein